MVGTNEEEAPLIGGGMALSCTAKSSSKLTGHIFENIRMFVVGSKFMRKFVKKALPSAIFAKKQPLQIAATQKDANEPIALERELMFFIDNCELIDEANGSSHQGKMMIYSLKEQMLVCEFIEASSDSVVCKFFVTPKFQIVKQRQASPGYNMFRWECKNFASHPEFAENPANCAFLKALLDDEAIPRSAFFLQIFIGQNPHVMEGQLNEFFVNCLNNAASKTQLPEFFDIEIGPTPVEIKGKDRHLKYPVKIVTNMPIHGVDLSKDEVHSFKVMRRFQEFNALHKALKKQFPLIADFPGIFKRYWRLRMGRRFAPKYIQWLRFALEEWLKACAAFNGIHENCAWQKFLSDEFDWKITYVNDLNATEQKKQFEMRATKRQHKLEKQMRTEFIFTGEDLANGRMVLMLAKIITGEPIESQNGKNLSASTGNNDDIEAKFKAAFQSIFQRMHFRSMFKPIGKQFNKLLAAQNVSKNNVGDVELRISVRRILLNAMTEQQTMQDQFVLFVRFLRSNSEIQMEFFLDNNGRRYKTWENFLAENKLPFAYIGHPKLKLGGNGFHYFEQDETGEHDRLEFAPNPGQSKLLRLADRTIGIYSTGASLVGITSAVAFIFLPMPTFLMATGVGLATLLAFQWPGVYFSARTAAFFWDGPIRHGQSLTTLDWIQRCVQLASPLLVFGLYGITYKLERLIASAVQGGQLRFFPKCLRHLYNAMVVSRNTLSIGSALLYTTPYVMERRLPKTATEFGMFGFLLFQCAFSAFQTCKQWDTRLIRSYQNAVLKRFYESIPKDARLNGDELFSRYGRQLGWKTSERQPETQMIKLLHQMNANYCETLGTEMGNDCMVAAFNQFAEDPKMLPFILRMTRSIEMQVVELTHPPTQRPIEGEWNSKVLPEILKNFAFQAVKTTITPLVDGQLPSNHQQHSTARLSVLAHLFGYDLNNMISFPHHSTIHEFFGVKFERKPTAQQNWSDAKMVKVFSVTHQQLSAHHDAQIAYDCAIELMLKFAESRDTLNFFMTKFGDPILSGRDFKMPYSLPDKPNYEVANVTYLLNWKEFDFKLAEGYGRHGNAGHSPGRAAAFDTRFTYVEQKQFLGFLWDYDKVRACDSRILEYGFNLRHGTCTFNDIFTKSSYQEHLNAWEWLEHISLCAVNVLIGNYPGAAASILSAIATEEFGPRVGAIVVNIPRLISLGGQLASVALAPYIGQDGAMMLNIGFGIAAGYYAGTHGATALNAFNYAAMPIAQALNVPYIVPIFNLASAISNHLDGNVVMGNREFWQTMDMAAQQHGLPAGLVNLAVHHKFGNFKGIVKTAEPSDLIPGNVVVLNKLQANGMVVEHPAIYVGMRDGQHIFIQNDSLPGESASTILLGHSKGGVSEVTYDQLMKGRSPTNPNWWIENRDAELGPSPYSAQQLVDRARSYLAAKDGKLYHLFFNNCQVFVNMVKYDKPVSSQVIQCHDFFNNLQVLNWIDRIPK